MATGSNTRKKSATGGKKKGSTKQYKKTSSSRQRTEREQMISSELTLLILLTVTVLLFLCNFGIIGPLGNAVSGFLFGIFGLLAYIAPIFIFLITAFWISNQENRNVIVKIVFVILMFFILGMFLHLIQGELDTKTGYSLKAIYNLGKESKRGGGILFGSLAYLLFSLLDFVGSLLVLLLLFLASLVVITEKSFVKGLKRGSDYVVTSAKDDARYRREKARVRREEQERIKQQQWEEEEERRKAKEEQEQALEAEKILRMDRKVSGVMMDTNLKKTSPIQKIRKEDVHEITVKDLEEAQERVEEQIFKPKKNTPDYEFEDIKIHGIHEIELQEETLEDGKKEIEETAVIDIKQEERNSGKKELEEKKKPYAFPPLSYLKKSDTSKKRGGAEQLKETAFRLQQTLQTFGVKVTITDISQGPAVTRYELQPEQGVKVSKIVGLADDIKLNLAATDIRMEAPIPGKAAIGIEVPNKENASVGLRDLLESKEYKEFSSKLCFAVGKDIAGKVVVADIAKMPHMLIAGSTGSGKSVCINTLIMSLLYKATPEEVKLIMIDPKVVELSVYNGIPHLLIPVVTDPKKAAAALHWGVAEMTDRYQRFADFNVRDLKGYNLEVERRMERGEENVPSKMAQIVIIVDELADLMMVAPGEVEESICRLAQLARAAGIHLIIATQRPSVDVITGLIKANMPSRVAFAVSSGVDSRTILDMNGAEKLLGKGDMLFYPQGYPKPVRVQGAFVSDEEVSNIVDFLKNQNLGNRYNEDIEHKIKDLGVSGSASSQGGGNEKDSYFVEAGKFIIEKEKASIGMLQRVFKIGFNRAARIMDQLAEAGIVGEEEGTKPRKVLMSMEQFEAYIEEYL